MEAYNIFFSPTGGTRKVLKMLNPFGEEVDLSKNTDIFLKKDDLAFIALPCYAGRCPELAIRRLESVYAEGTKAVAVTVYGNRAYEDALLELSDKLTEIGFNVQAAVSAIAEHSIIRTIAQNRPDGEDEKLLSSFHLKIMEKLKSDNPGSVSIPGSRPYKAVKPSIMDIKADKSICTRCGLCQISCPAGAISLKDPSQTNAASCIGCMRCVHLCPNKARDISKERKERIKEMLYAKAKERKQAELFL